MFEWMPVMTGAMLGLLQLRATIGQRTLLCLSLLTACITTASSGELFDAPQLIVVDLALVAAGVCVVRVLARRAPLAHTRHVAAGHVSRTQVPSARMAHDHAPQTRTDYHNDPAP
jgi:hypothetical protein